MYRKGFLLVLLAVVCTIDVSTAVNEKEALIMECANQEGYEIKHVQALAARNFTNASPEFKCFVKCLYEKAHVMQNGEFEEQTFLAAYPKYTRLLIQDALNDCNGKLIKMAEENTAFTPCDKAYEMLMCIRGFLIKVGQINAFG